MYQKRCQKDQQNSDNDICRKSCDYHNEGCQQIKKSQNFRHDHDFKRDEIFHPFGFQPFYQSGSNRQSFCGKFLCLFILSLILIVFLSHCFSPLCDSVVYIILSSSPKRYCALANIITKPFLFIAFLYSSCVINRFSSLLEFDSHHIDTILLYEVNSKAF